MKDKKSASMKNVNKQSGKRILVLIIFTTLSLVLNSYPVCAQGKPLTKESIVSHWRRNPNQDVQDYRKNMVTRREVGFLPTKGLRTELLRYHVPQEVIASLRMHVHGRYRFKFQVWQFESDPTILSASDTIQLARNIINQLQIKSDDLSDVFRHEKPPLPEPCVQTGSVLDCPKSQEPRLVVKGSITRDGDKLKSIVRLSYSSSFGDQKVGQDEETKIQARDENGLKEAAEKIVMKIHETLREEIKE
jgi:hypothetical protein